ncbi:MAG: hypothetical protein FJW27_08310 [Acidimicrobiia bacterium]|nr:hypothetical protein [Acidimicrobiia bacterium]
METVIVRKWVTDAIERAKRRAQDRRARTDTAHQEFATLLDQAIVPLCRQVAGALKAAGYPFTVMTPSGAVRLASERSGDDYIEITLATETEEDAADGPWVMGYTRRTRGRHVLDTGRPIRRCPVRDITEEDVLTFLATELEPFVER